MTAENALSLGETARRRTGSTKPAPRSEPRHRAGRQGARLNFVKALALYQSGQIGGGDMRAGPGDELSTSRLAVDLPDRAGGPAIQQPCRPLTPRVALDLYGSCFATLRRPIG